MVELLAKDYMMGNGRQFKPLNTQVGLTIPILPHLIGKEWNDDMLGVLHAVQPSAIRVVSGGEINTDHRLWRVTVHVDSMLRVTRLDQEVLLGVRDGASQHGVRVLSGAAGAML